MTKSSAMLRVIYQKLYKRFGPQHWWPGDSPFEVMIGAILTQNTNWANVEKAIKNLKDKKLLTPQKLSNLRLPQLARLIRPSGYYNIKSRRIKNFLNFLGREYGNDLQKMFKENLGILRKKLLDINGIGKETADSILLYACNKPIFVVDAYTRRVLLRHKLIDKSYNYDMIQTYIMDNITRSAALFNEFHALIVALGKFICKTKENCNLCPLNKITK